MAANNNSLAVGLDIGSKHVRCAIGSTETDVPNPLILGFSEVLNNGVRKGIISDIEEAQAAISTAVSEAGRMAGVGVNHASVGVNGSHLLTITSHGVIAIGAGNREVTEQDVARVEESATILQLPPNREMVQAYARNYQIDSAEKVSDPVGMSGMRLEVDMALVTAATPFLRNLERAVHEAGLEISLQVANPLAAADLLLTKGQRDQGVVLIDIGAATTGVAVYEEGQLLHAAVIGIGAHHITADIAIGLRCEIETAEKIKLEHVDIAKYPRSGRGERNFKIKEVKGEEFVVSHVEVNSIAKARVEEIFNLVAVELRKIKRDGLLPSGAVICGGGANLAGIIDQAKEILRLPARVGIPDGFSGMMESTKNPAYAVALGLMRADLNLERPPSYMSAAFGWLAVGRQLANRVLRRQRK